MTETLLQRLEERMMHLLTELEDKRKKIQQLDEEAVRLNDEIISLKTEKENNMKKLEEILGLVEETVNGSDNSIVNITTIKPVLVQQG